MQTKRFENLENVVSARYRYFHNGSVNAKIGKKEKKKN